MQDQLVTRLGLPDLARLVIGGFGNVDGTARAELGGVDLDATLDDSSTLRPTHMDGYCPKAIT